MAKSEGNTPSDTQPLAQDAAICLEAGQGPATIDVEKATRTRKRAAVAVVADRVSLILPALRRRRAGIPVIDDANSILRVTLRRVGTHTVPIRRIVDAVTDAAAVTMVVAFAAGADAAIGHSFAVVTVVATVNGDRLRIPARHPRGTFAHGVAGRSQGEKRLRGGY